MWAEDYVKEVLRRQINAKVSVLLEEANTAGIEAGKRDTQEAIEKEITEALYNERTKILNMVAFCSIDAVEFVEECLILDIDPYDYNKMSRKEQVEKMKQHEAKKRGISLVKQ